MIKILNPCLLLSIFVCASISHAQMQGNNRIQFEKEYVPACIQNQAASSYNKSYNLATISDYCYCISNNVVDRATVRDVNSQSDRLKRILDDASLLCAARTLTNK
jgi:hypothetical protein